MSESEPSPDSARPQRSVNWGTRILLALLTLSGVCAVLCCGGLVYIFNEFQNARTEDPGEIQKIRGQITHIELPAGFKPIAGVDMPGVLFIPAMKMVFFSYAAKVERIKTEDKTPKEQPPRTKGNFLMLGAIADKKGKEKLQEKAAEHDQATSLEVLEHRKITVSIKGDAIEFDLVRGKEKETDRIFRQVSGVFPGPMGICFLFLQLRDEDWDEAMVESLLKSIR